MKNKPSKQRRFETVFIQSDEPPNLRVVIDLIVKKISRGELNGYDESEKREIR